MSRRPLYLIAFIFLLSHIFHSDQLLVPRKRTGNQEHSQLVIQAVGEAVDSVDLFGVVLHPFSSIQTLQTHPPFRKGMEAKSVKASLGIF